MTWTKVGDVALMVAWSVLVGRIVYIVAKGANSPLELATNAALIAFSIMAGSAVAARSLPKR